MTNGLALGGIDMNPRQMARLMRDPQGIADMLTESGPTGDSPAEIFADIVNVHRADIRRLGMAMDVDVEAENMSAERAAELLAGTVAGEGVELVVMFNEMAEKRDRLLRDALDDDEYEQFMAGKQAMMKTGDPGGFEDDEEGGE
ncbi:ORF 19 [Haloarcula hispanica virus SH1]|uniref:ORF 19 n=1 Tax=Haloarcula hispanica SH1 virus TaxID=326574 RepID=Q4KPG8_9VIRU|nr:ORF 19 [Haloarcula hispanica virus SH1]AAY24945.1 ORF 19 [Haloarcula hispanica virus SH1]